MIELLHKDAKLALENTASLAFETLVELRLVMEAVFRQALVADTVIIVALVTVIETLVNDTLLILLFIISIFL